MESWRQKTPANAVEIANLLLDAGAEVDAMADMYGGSTTLGLVATSIHPLQAGVQNALIEALLGRGAATDHAQAAGNRQGVVNGCLANGRPGAAEYLAERGARLDLEGAAGVGRIGVVKEFFREDGQLKSGATREQAQSGLQWACQYGRTAVAEFLLERGLDGGELHRGQTALHWAAYGGHADIVKALLRHGPAVDLRDEAFGNTPLGWALYGWTHPPIEGTSGRFYEVVAALTAAGATVEPQNLPTAKVAADPKMAAALRYEAPTDVPSPDK
ncbi:MAG TPA: hypothetical protein DCE44_14650 [Verrucomicrobiales bacterium]|nr:hypothetical protein [Verrucomicrobiales bacterium]